jgi:murein DD-endopeptidase MepM/ murein hydrolase activator NlpD
LAACTQTQPAPVVMRGDEPVAWTPPPTQRHIVVERGQTLGGIAHAYHVREAEIIAANHLKPPYELKSGIRLVIPDRAAAGMPVPIPSTAAAPRVATATPLLPPAAHPMPDVVPLDGPAPKGAAPAPVVAPRNPAAALPRPGEEPAAASLTPPAATAPPPVIASAPPPRPVAAAPAAPASAQAAAEPTAISGGRFPWPVHGRILTGYGTAPDGTHNDGINIGAARGTPVRSIDAGVVAYVGNEVHGYGNLILVKHANGWISAYAHLDDVEVKVGDQIGGGQEVGKVGNSGGVIEPQLHFELRRGKKPVDPRAFLSAAPSAANPAALKG